MVSRLKGLDVLKARLPHKIRPSGDELSKPLNGSGSCERLKARHPNFIYDRLRHDKSSPYRLLETTLAKYLPDSVNRTLPRQLLTASWKLPAGYHLIFFPPPTTHLLKDGTDNMHFPGKPWVRRMWAGGSIEFKTDDRRKYISPKHNQAYKVRCREKITNAVVKGSVDNQKVWVDIRRDIGPTHSDRGPSLTELAAIIETRNLVFMPAKTPEQAIDDISKPIRTIKRERKTIHYLGCYIHIATDHSALATIKPDFSVSMIPDANLLFRFSSLTFNAHRIHLDREYARTVEGFRNLVVHGPLSLVLILKVLSSQMGSSEMVRSITYKNLAPLFADEKMTICVRRSRPQRKANSTEASADTKIPINADSAPEQAGSTLAQGDSTQVEAGSTSSQISAQASAQAESTSAEANSKSTDGDSEVTKWDVWIENAEGGYAVKGTAETVVVRDETPQLHPVSEVYPLRRY